MTLLRGEGGGQGFHFRNCEWEGGQIAENRRKLHENERISENREKLHENERIWGNYGGTGTGGQTRILSFFLDPPPHC